MFKPRYSITSRIVVTLNEIERLYGRLEGMTIPQQLLLNLERGNLIQSSFASNSIEGNPLSEVEVTNLILNERIPVNRDEKEIVNYFHILKELPTKAERELTVIHVLDFHKQLMSGVKDRIKGKIRNSGVIVGSRDTNNTLIIKHNPPFHNRREIAETLAELLSWIKETKELPLLKAGIFHHQFVFLHPFVDGNGRVCRLLTALILLKHNYLINKYFVLDDYYDIDRSSYSDSLHLADSGDKTKWLEYFIDGVKYSLQGALGKVETGLTRLTFDIRPTSKEREVLKIIQKYRQLNSSDLAKELNVSRQQAFNLLQSLTKKGYITKKGSTKNSYYILR